MNDNGLQGGKEMFLEIKDLKKGFGSGDSRTEVLRGIDFSVEKRGNSACFLDRLVLENPHF